MKWRLILAVVNAIYAIAWRSLKTRFELVTSRYRFCVHNCEDQSSFHFISAVHIWFISYTLYSLSILSPEHHWPTTNVSGFIALLVKAWRRCRAVTGSSTVEVLFFVFFFFFVFFRLPNAIVWIPPTNARINCSAVQISFISYAPISKRVKLTLRITL